MNDTTEPTFRGCPFCKSYKLEVETLDKHPSVFAVVCRCCGTAGPPATKSKHQDSELACLFAVALWNRRQQVEMEIRLSLADIEASAERVAAESEPADDPPAALSEPADPPAIIPKVKQSDQVTPERHPIAVEIEAYLERNELTPYSATMGISGQTLVNILKGVTAHPSKKAMKAIRKALKKDSAGPAVAKEDPEPAPLAPIGPSCNGIKSPDDAGTYMKGEISDWIDAEGLDIDSAAQALSINRKVLSRVLDGHLPHANCIQQIGKTVSGIGKKAGILKAKKHELDRLNDHAA